MTTSLTIRSLASRSLFTRTLLSPTALALALTTALSPLAAASRLAPRPAPTPAPAPMMRRMPVAPPIDNVRDQNPTHVTFAKPPTGWSGYASTNDPDVGPATPAQPTVPDIGDISDIQPPAIVTRATVRAALEKARSESMSAFAAYMNSQSYPSNTQGPGKLNVWRDARGHYCAAATVIRASGRLAIAENVGNTNNNLRLVNVKDGVLMDWILTSGLTQQEIDRIQEPFMWVAPDGTTIVGGMSMEPAVDQEKKARETWRLLKTYKATYAALETNQKKSLDVATDRLMAHPELARAFLDGSLDVRDLH